MSRSEDTKTYIKHTLKRFQNIFYKKEFFMKKTICIFVFACLMGNIKEVKADTPVPVRQVVVTTVPGCVASPFDINIMTVWDSTKTEIAYFKGKISSKERWKQHLRHLRDNCLFF